MAKQSDGAVVIRYGDSMVLVCLRCEDGQRWRRLPALTCEYIEKTYGGGKIPRRLLQARGTPDRCRDLVSRLIDRPARPLFPKGYRCDTQIIAFSLSIAKIRPMCWR